MLQSLFRRAEATVDNAISGVLVRALVSTPFLVALGFGTAGIAIHVYRELGSANGNLAMAGLFTVAGLITAAVLKRRTLNATRGWIDLIVAFKVQRRFRNNASKATWDLKSAPSLDSR